MKPVTDPALLAELDAKPVSDPALLAQLEGKAPPKGIAASIADRHPLAGAAETALAVGTGAVAAPVAGLVGIAQGLKNAVFPGTPAGDRVRGVMDTMTYQPRTEIGQKMTDAVAYLPEKIADGADAAGGYVAEATGSPAAGAAANTALQAVPSVLARGAVRPVNARAARINAETAAERSRNAVRDETLRRAQAEGLKVAPSAINTSAVNTLLESIGGKAAVGQELQRRNQVPVDRIAREEAGLRPDQPLTEGNLEAVRGAAAQPYREVSALPPVPSTNPMAGQFGIPRNAVDPMAALQELRQARRDANVNYRHYQRTADPAALTRYEELTARAQALDQSLETAAQASGRVDLIPMLRAARQQIAKTYDVERALNVGGGNVDARAVGGALDRGAPMTGGLETIGRFAEGIGRPYVRDINAVPTPGVSAVQPLASAALGIGGAAAAGPAGLLAAGLPLARGPVRSMVLSDWYQRHMAQPQYANPITLSPEQMNVLSSLMATQQAQQ